MDPPVTHPERIHVYPKAVSRFAVGPLAERFPHAEIVQLDDEAGFIAALPDMDYFYGLRTPHGHWGAAQNLKLIQVPGAGVDSVLPDPSLSETVPVCSASGVHEPEMSEFVLAMLFAITKKIPTLVDRQRERKWKLVIPPTLSGLTACVVGLGTIGQSVARRLQALDINVNGVRRSGQPVPGVDQVVSPEDRLEVLSAANIVIVITPKTPETTGLIDVESLAAMAPGSWLIDVSRGGVVDIDAVVAALDSGQLAGAALDVFPEEPLAADSPLWEVPGLLITPHTAGLSQNYFERTVDLLADNIEALAKGEPLVNLVDRQRGY